MELNNLPDDILHAIFRQLSGRSVLQCRRVCRRWLEAADSLSDKDWKKICSNDNLNDEYTAAREKYGLSWRDTFKALNSWAKIGSAEMTTQKLCDGCVQHFKVLPKGIVAILLNKRHKSSNGCSDTVEYYNTETFQVCGKEEYSFAFLSQRYDENEYFIVLVQHDCNMCIVLKENRQQFIVGNLDYGFESLFFSRLDQVSLIGKEVYFKNSQDEIIYVSKIKTEDGVSSIVTEPLEAFLENHESYEEHLVAVTIKDGDVYILSDEGNKGNVYIHRNADFEWVSQLYYDQPDIFIELKEYGFDWQSQSIYNWLSANTILFHRRAFYFHGMVYLSTRSYGKTICIHYFPYVVFGTEHLVKILKGKPHQKISTKELLPDDGTFKHSFVSQMDIIETSDKHKVLVLVGKKLFVLEFTLSTKQKRKLRSAQALKNKKSALRKTTHAKISAQSKKKVFKSTSKVSTRSSNRISVVSTKKKSVASTKKKSVRTLQKTKAAKKKNPVKAAKKKVVQTNGNKLSVQVKSAPNKHPYATRSSTSGTNS